MIQPVRFNSTILDAAKVASVTRKPGCVTAITTAGEEHRFTGDEAEAVWAYFVSRAPDGMKAPALTDPATSAAVDGRDREWEKALGDWAAANVAIGAHFQTTDGAPQNPGQVKSAMDWLANYLRDNAAVAATVAAQAQAAKQTAGTN